MSDVIFMYTGMALNGRDAISLTTDKLSADAVSESVTCASCGAISLFIGMSVLYINLSFAYVYNCLYYKCIRRFIAKFYLRYYKRSFRGHESSTPGI